MYQLFCFVLFLSREKIVDSHQCILDFFELYTLFVYNLPLFLFFCLYLTSALNLSFFTPYKQEPNNKQIKTDTLKIIKKKNYII